MKKYCLFILAFVTLLVQGQSIVRQVDNLSDLANYGDGFQGSYNVKYGYAEGDGLGGVFFYDPNGAASTNIFNVIDSVLVPGQWVRSETTQKELRLGDASGSPYTGFQAPTTLGGNVVYTMPATDGAVGQVLSTDGSLVLSWDNAATLASDDLGEIAGTKLIGPALYFDGSNDYVEVADDAKLTFSSSAEFGTNSSGTWSPNDNTPALTDGTGTLNQHYRVDSGAGTVVQGGSTLSIINGTATTAGQVVYYDGSVWRLRDVDDLPFSISFWIKHDFSSSGTNVMFGKYGVSATSREWWFYFTSNLLYFSISDSAGIESFTRWSVSDNSDKWTHICLTYDGAGPNSSNAFTAAADGMSLYVNGLLVNPTSRYNDASYTGMANTAQPLWLGKVSSSFGGGEYRSLTLHNRELSATEVAQLAKGSDLGFADEWAGALGGNGTIDETVGVSSWTGSGSVTFGNITETANTTVGGRANVLKLEATATVTGTETRFFFTSGTLSKRIRIEFDYYIPSGNTQTDTIVALHSGGSIILTENTLDTWTRASVDVLVGQGGTSATLQIKMTDNLVDNATIGDYIGIDNFSITPIGTLADFRAENFDSDTGKLYDLSTNAYVGVNSGAVITGRSYPVYETGTWTPTITFGGGSTGITYTTQEGHYTRFGNWVSVHAYILLSAKGSDTGTALVNGLPFTARNTAASSHSLSVGNMLNAANLTSAVTAYVTDNGTTVNLTDWGATGVAVLDDTNFAATTSISITGMYQIQ